MKNKINSDNYESFYLDYLEGNLGEDLTLSLFAFLAENPELQVEDLGPELDDFSFVLDNDFKNNLKQNTQAEKISDSNIEYFLTAEKEGQLSKEKINELNNFIETHPEYKLDRKIYSLSSVIADKSVIYGEKRRLKKRETIVLWPYLSAVAAACAVLVIWLLPNDSYDGDIRSAANIPAIHNKSGINIKPNPTGNTDNNYSVNDAGYKSTNRNPKNYSAMVTTVGGKEVNGNLPAKQARKFESRFADNISFDVLTEKTATAIAYQPTEMPEDVSTTLAMKNPVKPITNKLSDIIKTQVDYKTGENSVSQRKGFYLKIGTLEIYQNKKSKVKN